MNGSSSENNTMSADAGRETTALSLRTPANPTNSGQAASVKIRGSPSKYVKLNVGGSLFYTTIDTLTKQDNMLRAMFSGRMEVLTDSEGWILIDRSGKHFGTILNFLRDGKAILPHSRHDLEELHAEAKYYLVSELVDKCQKALKLKKDEHFPVCRIPVITSPREAKLLIAKTRKPLVRLLFNRANNKYSYTSASDDNILKNIEMFDKLSVRFHGRVNFVKDVSSGNEEICCWTYYGRGVQVAEISCTSIVYTSEKKQTKVEFPEARILEETLNVLLYEQVESENDDFEFDFVARAGDKGFLYSDEEDDHGAKRK